MKAAGISFFPGPYRKEVEDALDKMRRENIAARIWSGDYRVWKSSPVEISNRLGWLHAPVETLADAARIRELVSPFRDGLERVVLLGMGGSSLAAEVFGNIFGTAPGFPRLMIVDTTDPATIRRVTEKINPAKTLFIVASKSGTTIEVVSLFNYFYNLAYENLPVSARGRFLFISDEGSPMLAKALELQLPYVFSNNPDIGGRYSALSPAGIIPAALIGAPIDRLLENAAAAAQREKESCSAGRCDSGGFLLGAALGTLARLGRDKLTLVLPRGWRSFGDWLEQLVAESLGKEGKGILPVVNEPPLDAELYADDRIFVFFYRRRGRHDATMEKLAAAGHPVFKIKINSDEDLGGQMFLWEMATAVAGHLMGVNPFDQPDVEATKKHMARLIAGGGVVEKTSPGAAGDTDGMEIYSEDVTSAVPAEALAGFLGGLCEKGYVALQIYLSPSPGLRRALDELAAAILLRHKTAVTIGYGPRYLHSTGQLHKGDRGCGLFIQLTGKDKDDLAIPEAPGAGSSVMTFGELKAAQAEADRRALVEKGRAVMRINFVKNPAAGIKKLALALKSS